MVHLIDKDALVAEIEKRRNDWRYGSSIEAKYKREECDDIFSLIDTFEVKEVNLITKACDWLNKHFYDEKYELRDDEGIWIDADELIKDFKNYMKGE